jgi:ribonuclease HI
MELTAVIQGLRALKMPCQVEVVTDSSYVANAFRQGWLERWRKNGWTIRDRSPVKNLDLWQELLQAMEPHRVRWTWIKGHAGNSGNELADHLAVVERDRFSHS